MELENAGHTGSLVLVILQNLSLGQRLERTGKAAEQHLQLIWCGGGRGWVDGGGGRASGYSIFGASVLAPDFHYALLSSVTLALHSFIWIPSSTPLMLKVPSCHPCLSPYLCFAGGLTHLSITHPAVIAGFLMLRGASCPGLT